MRDNLQDMLTWFHQPPKTKFKILPSFLNKEECGPFTFLKTIFYKHTNLHCLFHSFGFSFSSSNLFLSSNYRQFTYCIMSHHFMANRWGNSGNSDRFFFGGCCKITADGDWSHEIKRHLLLGRKVMTNLDSILKSRDITLPQGPSHHCCGFSIVMYGCERWTIKKAEL